MQDTLDALIRRVPALELPLGRVQVILTPLLVLGVSLALILWVGSLSPLGGLLLALLAMGAAAWLAGDLSRGGDARPYQGALLYGMLPLAGLNGAVLLSLPWTGGQDLFPPWLAWPLFFYLLLTGLVLGARSFAEAGGSGWLLLDDAPPSGALHDALRHPALGALARVALALAMARGSALALLVGVAYAWVFLPRWAAALEVRRSPGGRPALWPDGVLGEARLLAALIDPLHPSASPTPSAATPEPSARPEIEPEYALEPEVETEPDEAPEPPEDALDFGDDVSGDFPDEDSNTEVIVAKEE